MEWFNMITADAKEDFSEFRLLNRFGDTAFSLIICLERAVQLLLSGL